MSMKIAIVSFLVAITGCSGWTVNGIPAERFLHAEPKQYAQLAAGAATSFAVHWLSHVVYLEAEGIEWHQHGAREIITQPISTNQRQWMGRIGFVGQLVGGLALKHSPWKESWFTTGYHAGSVLQIGSYPFYWGWSDGDLDMIGDAAEIEWAAYTTASIWLLNPRRN